MKRTITAIVAIMLAVSVSTAATPEEISGTYFELVKQGQWGEVAQLYDSTALADFREMMSFFFEIPEEQAAQGLAFLFGPDATIETVKAMPDIDFFASFLSGIMFQAQQLGQLDFESVDVLGSVPEGESIRHVVTRTKVSLGEVSLEAMEVISFKKTGDRWGILLTGKIKGMIQQIKARLGG